MKTIWKYGISIYFETICNSSILTNKYLFFIIKLFAFSNSASICGFQVTSYTVRFSYHIYKKKRKYNQIYRSIKN